MSWCSWLEVKKLSEKIDAATARRQADDPPAPYWLGLSRDEHAARLAELRAWVERVGLVQYPGYFAQAAALLASAPGGGDRAQHRDGGVEPDLRRPG